MSVDRHLETADTKRYIVALESPALASYVGGIAGLDATSPATVRSRDSDRDNKIHIDVASSEAQAYLAHLRAQQDDVIRQIRSIAPEFIEPDWRYSIVLNGLAVDLTHGHAEVLHRIPGVRLVFPEEPLREEMDGSRDVIGATEAWLAGGGPSTAGKGARIGIVEAGLAVHHPFLNDAGMEPAPIGYPLARVYTAGSDTSRDFDRTENLVNNKLIAVRIFAQQFSQDDLTSFERGERVTNHGAHIAGIIAGTLGNYEILPQWSAEMSGVAPMAHLLAYPVLGGTPELLAAMDAAAGEDRVDVLDVSMGSPIWLTTEPDDHPLTLAVKGLADAGVVVAVSAGNAAAQGSSSLTGAWKTSESVLAVGSSHASRSSGVNVSLSGPGIPDEMKSFLVGVTKALTRPLEAELVAPPGGGCIADASVVDKIVVIEERAVDGRYALSCTDRTISREMHDSGALAVLFSDASSEDVLMDIAHDDRLAPALPTFNLGYPEGPELLRRLRSGRPTQATVASLYARGNRLQQDRVAWSSSWGPTLDGTIKPDISAPGVGIISSVVDPQSLPDGLIDPSSVWQPMSGTSMAAAQVAGAAGVLRSLHPDWTADQVRAALITTSEPVLVTGLPYERQYAPVNMGGPGRLDLSDAHDPHVFLSPPKLSFGRLPAGVSKTITVTARAAVSRPTLWNIGVQPGSAGSATVAVSPTSLRVEQDRDAVFTLTIIGREDAVGETWGHVVLREQSFPPLPTPQPVYLPFLLDKHSLAARPLSSSLRSIGPDPAALKGAPHRDSVAADAVPIALRTLRLAYYAQIAPPAELRRNVLLVNFGFSSPVNHVDYYTTALKSAGLSYTLWDMANPWERPSGTVVHDRHPSLETMRQHDLVILNTGESPESLQRDDYPAGQIQYQNHLVSEGNLLITGQGSTNGWRFLDRRTYYPDTPENRNRFSETLPYSWGGPSESSGCEMCLARYFAGFTSELTATLSSRLLLPHGQAPERPERTVVLHPHPDAEPDIPFSRYVLDISTGEFAKDMAAGNQYSFASGDILREYLPSTGDNPDTPVDESQILANLRDVDDTPWVRARKEDGGRLPDYARPIWSFPVGGDLNVVGTYVAGKQHVGSGIPWNAMFWGFGLEGVGRAGATSVSRAQLLGDTFNFLARNFRPQAILTRRSDGQAALTVSLGAYASPVRFVRADLLWSDGARKQEVYKPPRSAGEIAFLFPERRLRPQVNGADANPDNQVTVILHPIPGTAAPVFLRVP